MKLSGRVTRPRGFCLEGALFIGYYQSAYSPTKPQPALTLAFGKSYNPSKISISLLSSVNLTIAFFVFAVFP